MIRNFNASKNGETVDLRAALEKRGRIHSNFAVKKSAPKSKGLLIFLIILLVLLVAAALAGFFIFNKGNFGGHSLKLSLAAPQAAVSGKEITLAIGYQNLDKVPLGELELVVNYPDGFFFNSASAEPYNQDKNLWRFNDLPVGSSGHLEIKGQLVGKIDATKDWSVVFHYRPANFNSDFSENLTAQTKISDVLLEAAVEAPAKLQDGDLAEFKVSYANKSNEDFSDLHFGFDFGEGFTAVGVTPSTTNYRWQMDKLAVDQKGEILVSGNIDQTKNNPFPWNFRIWQLVDTAGQKQERVIYQQDGKIEILAPAVDVKLELVDPNQKINWGETVNYKISYKNNGQLDIKEAVLSLVLNNAIDWPKYQNASGATVDEKNNTLTWLSKSGEAAKGLSLIPAGSEGQLQVSVPLKPPSAGLAQLSAEELIVDAVASLAVKFNGVDKTFTSDHLISSVTSQPSFTAEARYYLDAAAKVGSGPIPPVIGQETKYRIYWKLFTGSKGLSKVTVKTTLPSYITFAGPAGDPTLGSPLKFSESSRQLVWEIANAGPNSNIMAVFDVAVKPAETQVNQLLILTNATVLAAQEKDSNNLISKTASLLTSDLTSDPVAHGKGRVTVK
ncbi:MAG: hypothetical protein NTZ18_03530 [Candidatus Komeilibacteria bacterium]|nr:hypothetical protein [Candidatus Komeilibacteria bacterium]